MSEPAMQFVAERRVEFHETDMAGIVHFSNFFRYMEYAEQAFLRSLGLSVAWQADGERLGFPRVSAQCDYHRPARFDELLMIQVSIARLGSKSVQYRFDFEHAGHSLATGSVTAVCCRVNASTHRMESIVIPDGIRGLLEPYVVGGN